MAVEKSEKKSTFLFIKKLAPAYMIPVVIASPSFIANYFGNYF